MTGAGASASETLTTRFFDLGVEFHLERIDLALPNGLGSSDSITLNMTSVQGETRTFTITEANFPDAEHYISLFCSEQGQLTTDRVRFSFQLTAGTPSFSKLILYGTRA